MTLKEILKKRYDEVGRMDNEIAAIGLEYEQSEIAAALEGIDALQVVFLPAADIKTREKRKQTVDFIGKNIKAVIVKDISWEEELEDFFTLLAREAAGVHVIPIGSEAISRGFGTIDAEGVQRINRYFVYGGIRNVTYALGYIRDRYLLEKKAAEGTEPLEMPFDGIFHPEAPGVFATLEAYEGWLQEKKGGGKPMGRVGLLVHRSSWAGGNLAVEAELVRALEGRGICAVPVFSYGTKEPELNNRAFDEIIHDCFSLDGSLAIDALIHLQLFSLAGDSSAANIFQLMTEKLKALNIPVFRPLISHTCSLEAWRQETEGLVQEIPWSFSVPEMEGMTEPVILGCRGEKNRSVPIGERIEHFAQRVEKWVKIRKKPNQEKKLAIFLHNAPCSGVEATIGAAAGLDAFASAAGILKRLVDEDWKLKDIPASGEALHRLVMEKKAYSDFRWTSVEDIADSGGCIYQMPLKGEGGYEAFYERLDPECRRRMEETWGPPPGEGMVVENRLAITGIGFGNAVVMVQPKRGCYGAKCTGEVCKILQDPSCPPPHQYLATYRYVEAVFKADAVLHIGTHGSLEFLPGKSNALSGRCYPDAVLGSLPNLYIYNAGVGTEAILAKRRSYAVTLGHLPPVYSPMGTEAMRLAGLIGEYLEARYIGSRQADELEGRIRQSMAWVKGAQEIVNAEASFQEGMVRLRSILVQAVARPRMEKRHEFGAEPDMEAAVWYINEVILSEEEVDSKLRAVDGRMGKEPSGEVGFCSRVTEFIRQSIGCCQNGGAIAQRLYGVEQDPGLLDFFDLLAVDIREIYARLRQTGNEMENLISALKGGYVPPGPAGMPDENGRDILPTGRNLYSMNMDKIPTQAAYKVGSAAAEALLASYREDEGRLPEKIAMNMISLDITRSKGEQLSQVLYLMGITPLWDKRGRVTGLAPIPAEVLGRPRIDVTVRISGVLRDCYPEAAEMMDEAVAIAAALPEDGTINYIRRNTEKIAGKLSEAGIMENVGERAAIRIFGDRPGTYGAGVDLALKASAWKSEKDLARTFIYFSSFAYGRKLKGASALREFVENVRDTDASYDTTSSKRYDILDSNFGASVQGGFGLAGKMLRGKSVRQYHGSGEKPGQVSVRRLEEKLKETLEETLLNPLWKESVREKGYEGGAQLMQRLQNVFEWQCLVEKLEDELIDRVVDEYVNNPQMQQWFKDHNPYALEEAARRFLELHQRGKWKPAPGVLEKLRSSYLKLEGDMEEGLGEVKGDIQAGGIEILSDSDVKGWGEKLKEVDEVLGGTDGA